jgi:hypothetical protein
MNSQLPVPAMADSPIQKNHLEDLPLFVLLFMLFMASSYFTGFFPAHTAALISREPLARHILGYTILVTSISSLKLELHTGQTMGIAAIAYIWCYLISRQGPIAFSISVMLLAVAFLLNRDSKKYAEESMAGKAIIVSRRVCILVDVCIVAASLVVEF